MTRSLQKSVLAGLLLLGLIVGLHSAVAQEPAQCPSGGQGFDQIGTVDGVDFEAFGNSLTMTNTTTSDTATVSWCAELTEAQSSTSTVSGVMSTSIPGGESRSSTFDGDISHFVIYSVVHQDSGGPGPPPSPPGNSNGDGGGGGDRHVSSSATSKGGGSGGSGAPAPAPPALVSQPSVTG